MTDHEKDARIANLEAMLARGMKLAKLRGYASMLNRWHDRELRDWHAAAEALLGEHRPEGRTEHGT